MFDMNSCSKSFFRCLFSFCSNKDNKLWCAAAQEAEIWLSNFIKRKKKAPVDKYVEAGHIYNLVCEKGFTPYIRVLLKTSHILYIYIEKKVLYLCLL